MEIQVGDRLVVIKPGYVCGDLKLNLLVVAKPEYFQIPQGDSPAPRTGYKIITEVIE